jgi:hypothetical protein
MNELVTCHNYQDVYYLNRLDFQYIYLLGEFLDSFFDVMFPRFISICMKLWFYVAHLFHII